MVTSNGTALNDVLPLADNVGRTFSYTKTTSGTTTTETYTLTDSNGSPKAYTITSNNVSARTPDNMQTITVQMVTSIGLPNGRSYQFQYESNGYLTTPTFPSRAYIRYTYWYPNPTRQSGWYVASRIISSDGTAASEKTTTYTYNYTTDWSDGCSCYVSGSLPSTVVVDPTSGQTVHNFNPAGSNRETSTQTKTSGGTVLKEVQHTWQSTSLGWLVASETTIIGSYSFVSTFGYDSHNNLINQTDSEQGNILRVIHHTFLNTTAYANAHIWDRPIAEDIQPYDPVGVDDGNGGIDHWSLPSISRTQWQYDTLSLTARSGTIPGWVDPGSNPRGNATVIGRFLNTTNSYMNTTQQYDVLGNLVTVTDPGNHSTQTDYTDRFSDNVNRNSFAYPTQATDAGGFYKQSTYELNTGLLKQTTDSLPRVTTTKFDGMHRATQINYPERRQTTQRFR